MKKIIIILFFVFGVLCNGICGNNISLNGVWSLTFWEQPQVPIRNPKLIKQQKVKHHTIRANVPGNVEIDLQQAGIISDPRIGSNVNSLRPYEGYQWCYSRHFETPKLQDGQQVELYFGGIDCLADIWLNGQKIASTDNMFVSHTFNVTDILRKNKANELSIIIRSAVIESQDYFFGALENRWDVLAVESTPIRKAPHMFGWNIMPRLVSAGLWRDVELRIKDQVRIEDVFWITHHVEEWSNRAFVYADCQFRAPFDQLDSLMVTVTLHRGQKEVARVCEPMAAYVKRIGIWINDVELWWPRGYGDPALYDAKVEIHDYNGKILDSSVRKIGIRTVKLLRTDITTNESPGEFCFVVNGVKIFVKGTNWVPVDALHSRDREKIPELMSMLTDLNCNMVRCWGGNVYEDSSFYDYCDSAGIMVWQDFAMACSLYPQNEEFNCKLRQEVQSVIIKYRNHPSLVLWAGNNENDLAISWQLGALNIDPNRDVASRKIIPELLYEFDPTRPYLPSSPYCGPEYYKHGRDNNLLPETHLWANAKYYKDPFYSASPALFISEIGYHGCPNQESLEKMFSPENIYPWVENYTWNDEWLTKSTRPHPNLTKGAVDRNNMMLKKINHLFGEVPRDLNKFILASQFVQAEALKYFIERMRCQKFDKTGILWWNLRDGWPIISDAVVDYYNSKKLAYFFIKNVQHDVCVMITEGDDNNLKLVASNDTRKEAMGKVSVTDLGSGAKLYSGEFTVSQNASQIIDKIKIPGNQGVLLIDYEVNGVCYKNHYLYGTPPFSLDQYTDWVKQTGIYHISL